MFTGLIREVGILRRRSLAGSQLVLLQIYAPEIAPQLGVGDSVAVNGICLTATRARGSVIEVEAAAETLRTTTLAGWRVGRRLHLEPALRAGQALDGHYVLGHVDGIGRIVRVAEIGKSIMLTVECGPRLARWLLPKGSVAVDGVSLTVDAGPHSDRFTVNLVPHTLRHSTFMRARKGQTVNLEMDILVKAARTGDLAPAMDGLVMPATALSSGKIDPTEARPPQVGSGGVPSLDFLLTRGFSRKRTR